MFWAEICKKSDFVSDFSYFLVVKFSVYLNRRVFILYKITCAPNKDACQPLCPRSLRRVFADHSLGSQGSKASSDGQWTLIRLRICTGWSESSMVAHMQSCRKCYVPARVSTSIYPRMNLCISNGIVSTKIYDKWDDVDFDIVNFPFLDGDVPRCTSYGVCISKFIRFARAASNLNDFNFRNKARTAKLLRQGYHQAFSKFYRRHSAFVEKI